jgi:hypothetical protein
MITFVGKFDGGNASQTTVLSVANANGVDAPDNPGDLSVDVRLTSAGTIVDPTYGTFTVTDTGSNGNYTCTFSLNPGWVLAGIALKDGSATSFNYYSVNDETAGVNEGPVQVPANNGGQFGALSDFDFLLEAGTPTVPDGGTTLMLLGSALGGLGLMQRVIKR